MLEHCSCGTRKAERCFASTQNREPGSWNFSSVGEKNIPDRANPRHQKKPPLCERRLAEACSDLLKEVVVNTTRPSVRIDEAGEKDSPLFVPPGGVKPKWLAGEAHYESIRISITDAGYSDSANKDRYL